MMTARRKQAYDFIAGRILSTGAPPTYVEIGRHLGTTSKGLVAQFVACLIDRGFLRRAYRGADLELTERRPPIRYFRFDDETKQLVEWQP